ncbi:MAG: hypothetical protein NTX87_08400 [Planctomycetota bacterium]|nr:hypothetical protein [Planctomycetota bacterium]
MTGRRGGRFGWLGGILAAILAGTLFAAIAWASYIDEEFSGPRPAVRPIPPPPPPPPPVRRILPPPPSSHVPELARLLDRIEPRRPLAYGRLAVFPVVARGGSDLAGRWLTTDAAIARGILVVTERDGGGSVPVIRLENRSDRDSIFIMAGEVASGGKQTRTFRQDVILSPRQRVEAPVFCIEAHRWAGKADFGAGGLLVPQSIQREMRKGADQAGVWSEVARSNAAVGAENATGSLELALKSPPVRRELDEVRRTLLPEAPGDSIGFVFVDRWTGRAAGAEFFGRSDLALALLPKLIDAYAVDLVVPYRHDRHDYRAPDDGAFWDFISRIRAAGSFRSGTPGAGEGIQMRGPGLVGDGVGMADALVHFGCQAEERIVPMPAPMPAPRPYRE